MRLRRRLVGGVIALALRLAWVRMTGGLGAWSLLLMGICLGSLVGKVHVDEDENEYEYEGRQTERRRGKENEVES